MTDYEYAKKKLKIKRALHELDGLELDDVLEVLEILLETFKAQIEFRDK